MRWRLRGRRCTTESQTVDSRGPDSQERRKAPSAMAAEPRRGGAVRVARRRHDASGVRRSWHVCSAVRVRRAAGPLGVADGGRAGPETWLRLDGGANAPRAAVHSSRHRARAEDRRACPRRSGWESRPCAA